MIYAHEFVTAAIGAYLGTMAKLGLLERLRKVENNEAFQSLTLWIDGITPTERMIARQAVNRLHRDPFDYIEQAGEYGVIPGSTVLEVSPSLRGE